MKNKIRIAYMALLAIMVWLALFIQFYISTEKYMSQGRTFGGAIVQLLSYFTIQNNFLVALAMTLFLFAPQSKWGKWFAKPAVLASMCVYITIVLLVYQLVLRGQHVQLGWFRVCDEIFHSISPPMFILFWLVFIPKEKLPWGKAINWLLYPLIYCVYILLRGAISNYYPYSFIDGTKLTYPQIAVNSFFLLLAFLSLGLLFIGVSRLAQKR
ncbi:Pr6Pr family membrane protein [Mucilaginibacter sp. UYCu711]|uniref:Pr6Pr family membrane protein n=1 Tax=Mucilaginibacter sp. UYCu711 TaxID=3156339 RepID=UPI003D248BCF